MLQDLGRGSGLKLWVTKVSDFCLRSSVSRCSFSKRARRSKTYGLVVAVTLVGLRRQQRTRPDTRDFCKTSMSVQSGGLVRPRPPLCPPAEGQRCRASLAVKVCVESLISVPTAVHLVTVAPTRAKSCPTVLLRERRAKSANTPHSRTQTTLVFYAFESSQPLQPLPSRIWDLGCRSSSFFMVCCLAVGIRASVLSVLWWPGFVSWPAFWASRFVSQPVTVSWELGFVF